MYMRLGWILVLTVAALLVSTGVLSATVETRQIKSLLNDYAAPAHHGDNLGRSLRVTKESDENDGVTGEKDSIDTEERNIVSSLVSKVSEKIPISVKLTWWETIGKSTDKVKAKLGLQHVNGPALENYKNFPAYLTYVDRIEKHGMWENARKGFTTTWYWNEMEKGLGSTITTVQQLNAIKNTNDFRIYKRFAHIFDDSIVSIMHSGYYNPINFGNDPAAKKIEWWARAEIWGEYKRDKLDVKRWLGLEQANDATVNKNTYYMHYLKTFGKTKNPPTKAVDKQALRNVILAP